MTKTNQSLELVKEDQSLELVKEDITRKAVNEVAAAQTEVEKEEALVYLGGIGAISNLADKLSSQAIRALEVFEQSKGYKALGYETFKDFLNESRYSPVSKSQYYERLNALAQEGDAAYDLLNSLHVPISRRKKLPPGVVTVEDDTLVLGDQRIPLEDRRRVVAAIKTLAENNQEQAGKIEKGSEQYKKLKKERDELKRRGSSSAALDEYDSTLMQLLGLYANLVRLAFDLPDAERVTKRDYTFAGLADQRLQLEEALGVNAALHGNNGHGGLEELGDEM